MASTQTEKAESASSSGTASIAGREEKDVDMRSPHHKAVVRALSGQICAEVSPVPSTVRELKLVVQEQSGTPILLQRLVKDGEMQVLQDGEVLPDESMNIVMVVDETAMWAWNWENNPSRDQIEVEGAHVKGTKLSSNHVTVVTREPVRKGQHYFEFVMHYIGDEQSCGIVADTFQTGDRFSVRHLKAWTYYAGRMGSDGGDTRDGRGALHARGRAVAEFKKLKRSGDVIGMLIDMEASAVVFSLNGEVQGACPIRTDRPLYILTYMDTREDHVELRKPDLQEAPPALLDALKGPLLSISTGVRLRVYDRYAMSFYGPDGPEDLLSSDESN